MLLSNRHQFLSLSTERKKFYMAEIGEFWSRVDVRAYVDINKYWD